MRSRVTFEELGRYTHADTGKPAANVTRYTYTDGDQRYVVTFTRHTGLAASKFADEMKGPEKAAAKLAGFDGAYLRFAGESRIKHYQGEQILDSHTDDALWELMYFGKARAQGWGHGGQRTTGEGNAPPRPGSGTGQRGVGPTADAPSAPAAASAADDRRQRNINHGVVTPRRPTDGGRAAHGAG